MSSFFLGKFIKANQDSYFIDFSSTETTIIKKTTKTVGAHLKRPQVSKVSTLEGEPYKHYEEL